MQPEVKDILDFTHLFNTYKSRIYNYVRKMVRQNMAADDIVQNVFLKLYENIRLIRNADSISFWLFRTARNEVYGWYRKQNTYKKVFDPSDLDDLEIDSGSDLPEEIEIKEFAMMIIAELELLPEVQKEVFVLKEYSGLSYREIAELMETDENLVKSRLFKVRQKLIYKLTKKIT